MTADEPHKFIIEVTGPQLASMLHFMEKAWREYERQGDVIRSTMMREIWTEIRSQYVTPNGL